MIAGAEGWGRIEGFGETHLNFLKEYGDFENGIPVHDTVARVIACISPKSFKIFYLLDEGLSFFG